MNAIRLLLLLAARPPARPVPLVIVVQPDAGAAEPAPLDDEDRRLLENFELVRRYELLELYPLLAPVRE